MDLSSYILGEWLHFDPRESRFGVTADDGGRLRDALSCYGWNEMGWRRREDCPYFAQNYCWEGMCRGRGDAQRLAGVQKEALVLLGSDGVSRRAENSSSEDRRGRILQSLENVEFAVGKGGEWSSKSRTKPWKYLAREQGELVNTSAKSSLAGKRQGLITEDELLDKKE